MGKSSKNSVLTSVQIIAQMLPYLAQLAPILVQNKQKKAINIPPFLPWFALIPCDAELIRCQQSWVWAKTCSRAKKAPSAGRHWSEMRDPKNASGLQPCSSQNTQCFLLKTCHFFASSKQQIPSKNHKFTTCRCVFVMFHIMSAS